ncbi:MAG: hypothetical protein L6V93_16125 [Clostridiales bacterium]|nr:MAG: hypothetical protein L6V93_16125 [Clostridiales bacterium]
MITDKTLEILKKMRPRASFSLKSACSPQTKKTISAIGRKKLIFDKLKRQKSCRL